MDFIKKPQELSFSARNWKNCNGQRTPSIYYKPGRLILSEKYQISEVTVSFIDFISRPERLASEKEIFPVQQELLVRELK